MLNIEWKTIKDYEGLYEVSLEGARKEEYKNVLELNTDANKAINDCIDNSKYMQNKNYYDSLED